MVTRIKVWAQERWLFLAFGVVVFAIALIALRVHMRFWSMDTVGSDTYYAWVEGRRIREGRNPYERILHGGMEENNKYATYFPLFYEDSALVQEVGLRQYQPWIDFWRYIFLACNLLVGVTLAVLLFSRRTWALALLAVPFWYFNRWTLNASYTVALDFIPISLMVLSLGLVEKH